MLASRLVDSSQNVCSSADVRVSCCAFPCALDSDESPVAKGKECDCAHKSRPFQHSQQEVWNQGFQVSNWGYSDCCSIQKKNQAQRVKALQLPFLILLATFLHWQTKVTRCLLLWAAARGSRAFPGRATERGMLSPKLVLNPQHMKRGSLSWGQKEPLPIAVRPPAARCTGAPACFEPGLFSTSLQPQHS